MTWLQDRIASIFHVLEMDDRHEATVVLMDDDEIQSLNREFRGLDEPTDVLSFALQEAEDAAMTPDLLGDVYVSVETAARMVATGEHCTRVCEELGRKLDWSLREELLFLAVHGVLHLLGYDHAEPEEEAEMKAAEREIFFGVLDRHAEA